MNEKIDLFLSEFTKSGAPVTDLSRIKGLLSLVGNPQEALRFVHIAGTNGKGSTAAFIAQILMAAGCKTGLFTSPFMVEYNDRIRINGENIPDSELEKIMSDIEERIGNEEYSQFEITQTAAFLYFKNAGCDIVVLEAGIGGKNDSTNVISSPVVTVITSVSFDHTNILGDTLLEIASQKAGIIKSGSAVVISNSNSEEVLDCVLQKAYELECSSVCPPITSLAVKESTVRGSLFTYKGYDYELSMGGEHQISNAMCAIEAAEVLRKNGFEITPENIRDGLKNTIIPLRMECLNSQPLIIIDGAHNPGGMTALCSHIRQHHPEKLEVIIGVLSTKDSERVAKCLSQSGIAENVLCVDGFYPSAKNALDLARVFEEQGQNAVACDLSCVLDVAFESGRDILICGSLYLCTELRAKIKKRKQ